MPVFGNLGAFVGLRFKFSMFLWEVDGVHLDARTNYLLFYSRLQVRSRFRIYDLQGVWSVIAFAYSGFSGHCNSQVLLQQRGLRTQRA